MLFLVAGGGGLWLLWPLVGMGVVWFSAVTGEQTNDMVWRRGSLGSSYETLGVLCVGLSLRAVLVWLWRQQTTAISHATQAGEDRKNHERVAKLNGISPRLAACDKELQILEFYPGCQELLGAVPSKSEAEARKLVEAVATERRAWWKQLDAVLIESGVSEYRR